MDYKTGLNIVTFEARAILGLNIGYSDKRLSLDDLKTAIKKTVSKMNGYTFSGTLTPTEIVVSGETEYNEPAVLIETPIYPRFPEEKNRFKEKFIEFMGNLAVELRQERVAVRFTDESLMIETKYCQNPDIK